MTKKFETLVAVVLIFGVLAMWATHSGYQRVNHYTSLENFGEHLKKEFPEVEHISTETLASLIASSEAGIESLLLIDCRTDEEYRISHIAGAIRLDSTGAVSRHLNDLSNESPLIVVYGSFGSRSAKFARQLKESGYKDIKNVIGSIFEWANQDRPLVDSEGNPTGKVHPFNKFWSRHLDEDKRAEWINETVGDPILENSM